MTESSSTEIKLYVAFEGAAGKCYVEAEELLLTPSLKIVKTGTLIRTTIRKGLLRVEFFNPAQRAMFATLTEDDDTTVRSAVSGCCGATYAINPVYGYVCQACGEMCCCVICSKIVGTSTRLEQPLMPSLCCVCGETTLGDLDKFRFKVDITEEVVGPELNPMRRHICAPCFIRIEKERKENQAQELMETLIRNNMGDDDDE